MPAFKFSKDGHEIQAYPEEFDFVIAQGFTSTELPHDKLIELFDAHYDSDVAAELLQRGITLDKIPSFITPATSLSELDSLLSVDFGDVEKMLDGGFSLADAIDLVSNNIITYSEIPNWLKSQPAWKIIAWDKVINDDCIDEQIAEAAYALDIDPEKVKQQYIGYWPVLAQFAIYRAKTLYSEGTVNAMGDFVNWEAYGEELMQGTGIEERDGYYFNTRA
jgi:hypothetical protein